jgi:hypothetical protein
MAKRIVIAVTAQDIRQVEVMAGLGMTLKHISLILDISTNTLNRWLALEEVREAFDRGRAQGALAITKTAYSQAIDGNTTMLIFFLKTQLGWRDTTVIQVPEDSGAKIIIQMPDNGRQDRTPRKA